MKDILSSRTFYKDKKSVSWEQDASGQQYRKPSAFEGYCDAWMQMQKGCEVTTVLKCCQLATGPNKMTGTALGSLHQGGAHPADETLVRLIAVSVWRPDSEGTQQPLLHDSGWPHRVVSGPTYRSNNMGCSK